MGYFCECTKLRKRLFTDERGTHSLEEPGREVPKEEREKNTPQRGGALLEFRGGMGYKPQPQPVNGCKFKKSRLTHKSLNGLGPHFLAEYLSLRATTHPTHTFRSRTLQAASLREAQKSTTKNWAFSVVATSSWNSLLAEVPPPSTLLEFRKQIKACLFGQAFHKLLPTILCNHLIVDSCLLSAECSYHTLSLVGDSCFVFCC